MTTISEASAARVGVGPRAQATADIVEAVDGQWRNSPPPIALLASVEDLFCLSGSRSTVLITCPHSLRTGDHVVAPGGIVHVVRVPLRQGRDWAACQR
jgi:hypothetical protein